MRFDAGLGVSAAGVSDAAAPLRAAVAVFVAAAFAAAVLAAAADLAALVELEPERAELAVFDVGDVASAVDSGVEPADAGLDSSVGVRFAPAFVVRGFTALAFVARGFAALDFDAAVRGLGERPPACPDRDTRSSDTPLPVPSAASSS